MVGVLVVVCVQRFEKIWCNFFFCFISNPYKNRYFSGCVANSIVSCTFHLIVGNFILPYQVMITLCDGLINTHYSFMQLTYYILMAVKHQVA